jgi:3-deoxy-7-phosphoheptulonate synthase
MIPEAISPSPIANVLPTPRELAAAFPLSARAEAQIRETRRRIQERLRTGRGPALAIVGPCSLHSEEAAFAYAERLLPLSRALENDVIVVMRAYCEKPRTTVGWKGLLYDPNLNGENNLPEGLRRSRALLVGLAEMGLPLATEILDPLVTRYLEPCLSWAAIGARTTESQIHRQAVSGLECPVGFKNGTDGSVDAALDGIEAARARHTHLAVNDDGRIALEQTPGNPHCHVVLRGGKAGPNFDSASIGRVAARAGKVPLLVDCSHGNSEKDYRRQPAVARSVFRELGRPDADVLGIMLESHIEAGKQPACVGANSRQSVTDACIDIEETVALLEELARASRRAAHGPERRLHLHNARLTSGQLG